GFDASQIFLMLTSADGDGDMLSAISLGEGLSGTARVSADVDVLSPVLFGESFSSVAHVNADGSFEWKNVPPGRYFVQLGGGVGASSEWFVKSVVAGGRELKDSGLSVSGGAAVLDVTASMEAAVVGG